MSEDFSKLGFAKTYVYPALALFLIPIACLIFYEYVQSSFDQQFFEATVADLRSDPTIAPEDKAAAIEFLQSHRLSDMLVSSHPQDVAFRQAQDSEFLFYQLSVVWAIRISWACILAGIAAFVMTGIGVLISLQSQAMQYTSLLIGWMTLRIFCKLEVIAQGLLIFSLSFWIPAFFFDIYIVKLIIVFACIALGAIGVVIAAIFKRPDDDFVVQGEILTREMAPQLWYDLELLSGKMQTAPPDHVIAGIDDNFFVTQLPIKVQGKDEQIQTLTGRSLFVSLSLLKKLPGQEADAVLLHELAHFSGNDTLYSQRIAPLLARYDHFLQGLYEGGLSMPVFYFAVMFRALYEISLGSLSRQREFRADRLAAEGTSPHDMAHALLRITAYSQYRAELEKEFFDAEEVHQQVNLSERIDGGFLAYTSAFVDKHNVGDLASSHPFDSHPPLKQRLEAIGFSATPDAMRNALYDESIGTWFQKIEDATILERDQWTAYEEQFRQFHENILAYRYLPANESEQELVEKFFPPITHVAAKDRPVEFDYEKVTYEDWDGPIYYREIESMSFENEWGARLDLVVKRNGKNKTIKLPLSKKQNEQQEVMGTLQNYYARAASAIAYQQSQNEPEPSIAATDTFSFDS